MKDYFSRLIQQTGITVASAQGQSLIQQNNEATPTHTAEEKFSDHSRENTEEKNSEDITGNHEILSQISKREDVRQPERYEEKFLQNSQSLQDIFENSNVLMESENFHKSIEERFEIKFSQESKKQEPAKQKALTLNLKQDMVKNEKIRDNTKNLIPISKKLEAKGLLGNEEEIDFADMGQQSKETIVQELRYNNNNSKSTMESIDQIIPERQNCLKEVREWVAGTPLFDGEEIKNRAAIETMESEKKGQTKGDIFTPSYPEPHQRPELNDLHLSIGTISLIIEGPQKKEPPQQIIKVENRPIRETETSRLSRYYIRMR